MSTRYSIYVYRHEPMPRVGDTFEVVEVLGRGWDNDVSGPRACVIVEKVRSEAEILSLIKQQQGNSNTALESE